MAKTSDYRLEGYVNGDSLLAWLSDFTESPLLPHEQIIYAEEGVSINPEAKKEGSTISYPKEEFGKGMEKITKTGSRFSKKRGKVSVLPLSGHIPIRGGMRGSLSFQQREPPRFEVQPQQFSV